MQAGSCQLAIQIVALPKILLTQPNGHGRIAGREQLELFAPHAGPAIRPAFLDHDLQFGLGVQTVDETALSDSKHCGDFLVCTLHSRQDTELIRIDTHRLRTWLFMRCSVLRHTI